MSILKMREVILEFAFIVHILHICHNQSMIN